MARALIGVGERCAPERRDAVPGGPAGTGRAAYRRASMAPSHTAA